MSKQGQSEVKSARRWPYWRKKGGLVKSTMKKEIPGVVDNEPPAKDACDFRDDFNQFSALRAHRLCTQFVYV
jgi:hypothetical protein